MIWLFIIIYGAISLIWVPDFNQSIGHFVNYFYGIILIIICILYINHLERFEYLIKTILINVILVMFFSLYESFVGQYYFSYHPIWSIRLNTFGVHHPIVQFYNPNDLGVFITMFSTLLIIFYKKYTTDKDYIIYFLFIGALIITFLTDSKSCQIMLIIYIIGLLFNSIGLRSRFNIKTLIIGYGLICSIFLVAIFLLLKIDFFTIFTNQFSDGFFTSNSMQTRFGLWKIGINIFFKNPFSGVGIGATEYLISNDSLIRTMYGVGNIHNFLIEFLADFGFFNFLLFIYIIIKIFSNNYRFKDICQCEIIIFLTSTIILTTFSNMLYMWLFLGIMIVLSLNQFEER